MGTQCNGAKSQYVDMLAEPPKEILGRLFCVLFPCKNDYSYAHESTVGPSFELGYRLHD
jgi:hypothetical protein